MNMHQRIRLWRQAPWLLLMVWGLAACGKVENPNHEKRSIPPTLFFNYVIVNPAEPVANARRDRFTTNIFEGVTLQLYALAGSFPSRVVEEFSRRYGGNIKLTEYQTDQELQDRIAAGERPDVLLPTENGVARLKQRNLLTPLDHHLLTNIRQVAREFRTKSNDPELVYSVPYFWSTAGIAYNFARLDFIPHTWGRLFEPASTNHNLTNHIALMPGPVRPYSAALLHLGHSINTTNAGEIAEGAEYLARQAERYHIRFLRATVTDALVTEQVWMAQTYSSDASRARARNKNLHFIIPEEGSWLSLESLVIPKSARPRQVEMAHAFFDYLLEPTVAAQVVEYSHLATTVSAAKAFIDPQIKLGAAFNQSPKAILQQFNPVAQALREQHWRTLTNRLLAPVEH